MGIIRHHHKEKERRSMILLSAVSVLSILPVYAAFVLSPPSQATKRLSYYPRHDRSAIRYTNGKDDEEEKISALFFPRMRHSFLDLNGDGKIDEQDLDVLQQRIVQCLDVNGDGHLDEKDAIQVLHLVILSWTLSATPAVAKGGGHGGGGGGGHSSSHHSSVHHSTTHRRAAGSSIGQSHYDSRGYYRTWYGRNSIYDKPWNPAACRDLPGEGERIKVVSSPSLFSNRHVPAIVTAVDEATCSFSVQGIQDNLNGPSVSDDDAFATQSFQTTRNWEDDDSLAFLLFSSLSLFVMGVNAVNMACFQAQNEWFDKRFVVARQATAMEEHDFLSTTTRQATPTSERYVGTTRESDGANQDIQVKLHLDEETRTIHGSGYDSDDGNYSVEGEWAGKMVKWKETYRNGGFTVDVRGHWNEDASEMDGWFVSSRRIRGTFVLRKKKKWGLMMIRSNEQRRL